MTIVPLYGHDDVRTRLVGAIASSRLPQALLFVGPDGVGKQRLALWLAQALVCDAPGSEPCGECRACGQVLRLEHPDVHWFVPIPRAPGTDQRNEVERAEAALAEAMAERRQGRLYPKPGGLAAHRIASVRLLRKRLVLKPASAARNVVVIGDAERLVSQESSPEAANALLKVLEEPPPHTTFVLTTGKPQALLSTVRSRLVTVRVPRLTDDVVAAFLTEQLSAGAAEARKRAPAADGRIGQLLTEDESRTAAAEQVLASLRGPESRAARALGQPPWSARGDFTELLDALAWTLRNKARRALAKGNDVRRHILALDAVAETRGLARGNVNPQLLLADLMEKLAEAQ